MSTTGRDPLQDRRVAAATEGDSPAVPPPQHGISAAIHLPATVTDLFEKEYSSFPDGFFHTNSTPQELERHSLWIFKLMTISKNEDAAASLLSKLDEKEIQRVAFLLTSDIYYFVGVARNKNGSKLLQMLIGKSDEADAFFSAVILHRFFDFMTHRHASCVVLRGLRVFDEQKKVSMCRHALDDAISLACDQHGCIALNDFITDLDHPQYRDQLLDIISRYALPLSKDAYGNLVVQHVLKLNDLRCKQDILVSLRGCYVDLSFNKYGMYVVRRLLEAEEGDSLGVFEELMACDRAILLKLARNEYGKCVVSKALRVTQTTRADLFSDLVHKLNPRSNIAGVIKAPERSSEKDGQINAPNACLGSKEEEEAERETDGLQDFTASLTQNVSDLPVEEEVLNYNTAWIDPDLLAMYDSVRPNKKT